MSIAQRLAAPESDASRTIEALGNVEVYDAVLNCDYAFVIWKETDVGSGEWRVRLKSSQTTGVVFEPDAMTRKARETGSRGEAYFTWGTGIDPSAGDARKIEYRVHQIEGRPAAIEVVVVMRKFDGSAGESKSLRVDWPGAK